MSMTEWAENEVRIACERERAESKTPEGEWDYGCACYESALKAYKFLMEDGHSGMSFSITRQILNRLMRGQPLTPIEDTEDIWGGGPYENKDGSKEYQCKRMSSLFKRVYPNGKVTYSDNDRYYAVYSDNPNVPWHNGLIRDIIDEMFPITMPYVPGDPIKVVCKEFLVDPKNGDYDTIGILYAIKDGEKIEINRFFAERGREMVEIQESEYMFRKLRANERFKPEYISWSEREESNGRVKDEN